MSDKITAPINDFCQWSGISRRQVYRMLDRGQIESVKIGDMRLVIIDSYRRLIERTRVPPKRQRAAD